MWRLLLFVFCLACLGWQVAPGLGLGLMGLLAVLWGGWVAWLLWALVTAAPPRGRP